MIISLIKTKRNQIEIKIIKNNKVQFSKQKTIKQLLILEQNSKKQFYIDEAISIEFNYEGKIDIRGNKKEFNKQLNKIYIQCFGKITLQNIFLNCLELKAKSFIFKQKNQIYYLFIYNYQQDTNSECPSKLKLSQNSKLTTNRISVINSDIIIQKSSVLRFNTKQMLIMDKNSIFIHPYALMVFTYDYFIKTAFIQNKGKIQTDNQHRLIIATQKIRNTGHIKILNLALQTNSLINQKYGKIQGNKSTINIHGQNISKNQGQISVYVFLMVQQQNTKNCFENNGNIVAQIIDIQIFSLTNNFNLICNNLNIKSKEQNSFLNNKGLIYTRKKISIENIHIFNSQVGDIICQGNSQIMIKGWLNYGNLQSSNQSSIKSQGIISNKGSFKFNKKLQLQCKNLNNQKSFQSNQLSNIKVQQIFLNTGKTQLNNTKIQAKYINNLNQLSSIGITQMKTNCLFSNKNIKLIGQTKIQSKDIFLQDQAFLGSDIQIKANYMISKAQQISANTFNFEGDYLRIQKSLDINQKGKINVKTGFSDSKQAKIYLNNVEFTNNNQILQTHGQIYFHNPKFNKINDVYNSNKITFHNTKQQFRSMNVNDLQIKNAHIASQLQQTVGLIYAQNGGIYQGSLPPVIQQNPNLNEFVIQTKSKQFYKNLKIVLKGDHTYNLKTVSISKYQNGWTLLQQSPIVLGNFHHHLICQRFDIPFNRYYRMKQPNQTHNSWQTVQLPHHQQKSLKITTNDIKYKGKLQYYGESLTIQTQNMDLKTASIQVPEGILSLKSEHTLKLVNSYLAAKGIRLMANQISTQAIKFVAGLQGIVMQARKIHDKPTITNHEESYFDGQGKATHVWQQAKQSQFISGGDIIISAQDYIYMVAPVIQAQKKLWINSPNTVIHGVFLMDKTTTVVQKDTIYGGTKTNTYQSRNDKPCAAKLSAEQIILQGNARLNADFKANKIYDLTNDGVELFFVIGYYGQFENRQFSNALTQGCVGHNYVKQKLLKANLSQVAEIIRPQDLPGHMKFDTVQWGKVKAKVTGQFVQKVYTAKSWYTQWQHETISKGALMIIGMAASFIGAHFIAPSFITAEMGAIQVAMVKAGISTLTNKLAISLAASGGNLDKAFSSFFSVDTLKALVFNIATSGLTGYLTKSFDIQPMDANNNPVFIQVFKQNLIKHAVSIPLDAIINGNMPQNLQQVVMPFVVDVFGQYTAGKIGKMYLDENINYLVHKGLHGIVGAIGGFLLGKNSNALLSGALAAVAAQVALQAMVPIEQLRKKSKKLVERMENGQNVTGSELIQEMQIQIAVAKMIGVSVGGVFGKNWDIARNMATNAVDNNWVNIAVAIGHQAIKALLMYLLKQLYDENVKPILTSAMNISPEQKQKCDQIIQMVKDGVDIFKGYKALKTLLTKPPKDVQQFLIYQIQNFAKTNPKTLGNKIANFTKTLGSLKLNLQTCKYLAVGLIEAGVFYGVDKLLGLWKKDLISNYAGKDIIKGQAGIVGSLGTAALAQKYVGSQPPSDPMPKHKTVEVKPLIQRLDRYQMQNKFLDYGIRRFGDY